MQAGLLPVPPINVNVVARERGWYLQWDLWLSLITLALALVTSWLAWETRKMRQGSDKAIGELSKHAEDAASAAKESAMAAKASANALTVQAGHTANALEIAKRNAESADRLAEANEALAITGQRAWIIVNVKDGGSSRSDNRLGIAFETTFRNSGPTPAANVEVTEQQVVRRMDESEPDLRKGSTMRFGVMSPGAERSVKGSYYCTPEETELMRQHKAEVWIHGNVLYRDVFGNRRNTSWRYKFGPDPGGVQCDLSGNDLV